MSSYRDSVRWYKFRAQSLLEERRTSDAGWAVPIQKGPVGTFAWDCGWNDSSRADTWSARRSLDGSASTFCFLPQQVEATGLVVGRSLDDLLAGGVGPAPTEAEQRIARHLANLQAIPETLPD